MTSTTTKWSQHYLSSSFSSSLRSVGLPHALLKAFIVELLIGCYQVLHALLLFSFQNMAFIGALLFFLGTKNPIPRRRSKGRTTKTKTN
jgi:Na+/citrate or Na+/malate symporter